MSRRRKRNWKCNNFCIWLAEQVSMLKHRRLVAFVGRIPANDGSQVVECPTLDLIRLIVICIRGPCMSRERGLKVLQLTNYPFGFFKLHYKSAYIRFLQHF